MRLWKRVFGVLAALALAAAGAAAQGTAQINGEVRDSDGKPFPDVVVVIKSDDFGTTYEVKTNAKGLFTQAGMRTGIYTLTFKVKGQPVYETKHRVVSGDEAPVVIDFKEIVAKQGAEYQAARKKQEEEMVKFENMKTHFEAGKAALDQAKQMRDEVQRAPADQKPALQEKLTQLQQTAISEYEAAEKAAPDKDPNLHKVMANLGQAYEVAGRFDESAAAFEKAVALRPTEAGYYLGWGTALARTGKVKEAGDACERAVPVDKVMGSTCWRNVGIVLYNTNNLKEAVGPLRRATELDPAYADAWYLLGASLVAAMEYKKEGDKFVPVVQPGTAEAYQKYLDLAPSGRFANDAKAGLSMLESLGAGIETKLKTRKK